MNIIRQNTDYALRAMVHLALNEEECVSTRVLADKEGISFQFASKILQKLQEGGLVSSTMGPKGGFKLAKAPKQISLLQVVETIQGPLSLNSCLLSADACPRKPKCPITGRLAELQKIIEEHLGGISLEDLVSGTSESKL